MINRNELFVRVLDLCWFYGRATSLQASCCAETATLILETTGVCASRRYDILQTLRADLPLTWAIEIRNAESERIG